MPKKVVVPHAYIKELLDDFLKTQEGRDYFKQETGMTYDSDFTRQKANSYVNTAARIIYTEIHKVIKSFKFTDLIIGEIQQAEDKHWYVEITLNPESVHRDSLYPKGYPEGVENIVLHFAHGWNADGTVYGEWHEKHVSSRQSRSPNNYLENAVSEINSKTKGVLKAELSPEYLQ